MTNTIDLDNLTLKDIEKLKKALNIKEPETDEQAQLRRQNEIGTRPGWMKVIQINMSGNKYFCETEEESMKFLNEHKGESETFKIEMPISTARKYLDSIENKKAFGREEK